MNPQWDQQPLHIYYLLLTTLTWTVHYYFRRMSLPEFNMTMEKSCTVMVPDWGSAIQVYFRSKCSRHASYCCLKNLSGFNTNYLAGNVTIQIQTLTLCGT